MKKSTYITISFLLLFVFQFSVGISSNAKEVPKKKRPKIGLVLSGGGAKGFAYIGLLNVLNEVGLHIDYIGGTSIGSIMGGLYAIGYSPETIQNIIETQDWEAVLKDEIPRKYIAYEEKEFLEHSIISFPFRKRKVSLNKSMYNGQQINLMLNRYFSPAWNIQDFNKLQTPFLCVAANLYNGNAEVLQSGYLPMAVRSSMSIPGYFSPTYYNGKYLVDGGIVNNYPAGPMMKNGAELLVGGDVQSPLKDTITDLQSLTDILNQIVFFHAEEANHQADSLISINVKFKVPAGMMDFTKYDTIIKYGEYIANQYRSELQTLADSLNAIEYVEVKPRNTIPLDYIDIADVIYEGNEKMSSTYLDNYFEDIENSRVTFDEIEHVITSIYGTRFFQYIFYELEPAGDGSANLIIKMEEASPGYISASIHYDFDYHGSVRVNGIFRNVLGNRSKLFSELVIGTNPRLKLLYLLSNGAKPGFGIDIDMYEFKFADYDKSKKINSYSFRSMKSSAFIASTFKNLFSIRAGFEYEYFQLKQTLNENDTIAQIQNFNSYGSVFLRFRADTRDKQYYATKGSDIDFKFHYVMPFSEGWSSSLFSNSLMGFIKYETNVSMSNKFVLRPGFFIGGTLRDELPPVQHWFGLGGLNEVNYLDSFVPFTGVSFVQKFGLYAGIARLKLQYNVYEKIYVILRSDLGASEDLLENLVKPENTLFGYGITAAYNSFVGPVEFTVMGSNINPSVSFFVNIGFSF